jgi:hypothetical protein
MKISSKGFVEFFFFSNLLPTIKKILFFEKNKIKKKIK